MIQIQQGTGGQRRVRLNEGQWWAGSEAYTLKNPKNPKNPKNIINPKNLKNLKNHINNYKSI